MSAADDKKDSASGGDEENLESTTTLGSPTTNQPSEKSSRIGSGDAKNIEKEGNLVSTELQKEELVKTIENNPSLEVNTVALSEKSLTNDSVIEISSTSTSQDLEIVSDTETQKGDLVKTIENNPSLVYTVALSEKPLTNDSVIEISSTSTSQDLEIDLDTKTERLLEFTKSEEAIIEKSLEKTEVKTNDDEKEVDDDDKDKQQTVDVQNDSFDDEMELKWDDDDDCEQGASEEALKLLDQELGFDDIISTSEIESKTENIFSNDQLKAKTANEDILLSSIVNIERITMENEKSQIESQELPKDCTLMEIDEPTVELTTQNNDVNVSIEEMDMDLADNTNVDSKTDNVEEISKTDKDLADNTNIDSKTDSVEVTFKTDIDLADNTSNTEKDYLSIVEEASNLNKDSNKLIEVQTEDLTKISDTRNDIVDNQNAKTIESTPVFDIKEVIDDTDKQDIPNTENNLKNTELNTNEVSSQQIEESIETDKVETDNNEMSIESKGMKTDLGMNKPDVMLEIPTQELIDIDEFDDTFDDKDMHSIEKKGDSVVNTKFEDNLTKLTEDEFETELSKADKEDKNSIIKTTDSSEKSSDDSKSADINTKSIDTNPGEKSLLIDEHSSTSKDVVESLDSDIKSVDPDIKLPDSDLKSHSTDAKSPNSNLNSLSNESKSLDPNVGPQDPEITSTETSIKLDEQPSTSKADDMIEEPEAMDSLLAESSRIMDDDDDHDEDRDDDSDDFDQDDESSNHMTAEHSEESNPPPSESEAVEKDDDCEKETAVPESEVERDNDEPMDIVDDIVCEENEIAEGVSINTTLLNEDSLDIKSPTQVDEATEQESQAKERDGTTPEKDKESLLKKLLIKDGKDSKKKPPSKSTNIFVSTNAASVLSYVDLGDSDEDVQEAKEKKIESKTDEQDDSIDITKDETEKTVVKSKPVFKMTKLNTSEVSIKTGVSSIPPLIIPEITNTAVLDRENAKKHTDSQADEVFTLDSDSEEEKEKEEKTKSPKEGPRYNTKCMNPVCTSNSSQQHYIADACASRYYGPTKKRAICETCRDFVNIRNQTLIDDIKNLTPLLELDMEKPTNSLVEISDSESEDESDVYKECNELIGQKEANILSEKVVDMINDAWLKFNMDDRLKDSENFINEELQKLEDEGAEVKKLLDECQLETDKIRKELYETFYRPHKELPPIVFFDTPLSSYTCLEKDAPVEKGAGSLKKLPDETTAKKVTRASESAVEKKEEVKSDKQDDDRDVSVVYLSAESAPTDLPPPGEVVRPPLRPGLVVHAMRNAFGSWLRGRILDILPKTPGQLYTHCRVKFDHNVRNPCKVLPARCIAFQDPCNVRMTIGTRVLALFRDTTSQRKESFYSGVVAEIPNPVNNYRYLVFFDDGYAQYVKHQDTRLVCESKGSVWEEVHPFISDFVKDYLLKYPERPMVRLHAGQRLNTEWNGKWWSAKVLQVDASLAHVHFEEDNRTEWIYRGSTRLAPLYLELQAAERHRTRLPRSKAQFRSNMPYVEYMRSEEQMKAQQQDEMLRRQRAVAKKSTTPSQAQAAPVEDKPDNVTSRVVYYSPKNAVKPKKMVAHTCGSQCKRSDVLTLKELRTYNPLAKPLLSGWERVQVRYRGSKAIMYRAPCGRRLRNIKEVHKYLRLTDSELPVDLFDFNVNTHCLAEFVLNKYNVMKKDLSHGKENVPVPCVNYYDDSLPEFCSYNTERTPTAGVPLNLDPDFLCGCDCEDDCEDKSKCACWKMTLEGARTIGLDSADVGYVYRRLPEPLPSGIYECNSRCKCKSTCLNRVAQQPLQLKLQVFKTLRRGWGIRALNDVPKGSFLCVYAGNLLTDATANLDGLNEGDEYLAELDYIEVAEQMKEGYEEDIPDADKKLDKKESKKSESEDDEATESEEEQNDSDKMDDDFRPGFIGMGLTDFDKRLRKRNKKKQEEEKEKQKEDDGQKTDGCITISDDEEVREPSRFTAQAGMGDKGFVSRYKSVRTLFGEDEACYIMDAKVQGNIGRYLNHSCTPNVFVQNVFVDTHDPRFPWVAFFALAHVRAGTELTWNYNYDIGSVPGKVLYCYCGAPNCRGRLL